MSVTVSAIIFTVLTGIVIIFQGCLAAGVPWGKASMGGKYPGKYPPKMRVVAVLNMLILSFIAAIVLSEANVLFPQLNIISTIGIYIIVVFFTIGTNGFRPKGIVFTAMMEPILPHTQPKMD